MKVLTWNVFNRNPDPIRVVDLIQDHDADVCALQELTGEHVAALREVPDYRLHLAEDFMEGDQLTYLGLLVRYDTNDERVLTHNGSRSVSPSIVGRRLRWVECLQSQSITVICDSGPVRVANVHLTCGASPRRRLDELRMAYAHLNGADRAVLCGDFNSFGLPWRNALVGWAYGFGLADLMTDEIASLDSFTGERSFVRAVRNAVTLPKYGVHIDHVFARGLNVRQSQVDPATHGSDHRPVIVEFDD